MGMYRGCMVMYRGVMGMYRCVWGCIGMYGNGVRRYIEVYGDV